MSAIPASPSAVPALPPIERAFSKLAPRYDLVLCDVWGVLHNGAVGNMAAADALVRAREAGLTVILVSNAPRPKADVARILDTYSIPRNAYDDILTSGIVTAGLLAERGRLRLYHLGPDRDLGIYAGLDIEKVPQQEAELVVCTGLFDDTVETPEDYAASLADARARGLPMICANPDIVVERGGELVWCAGALAEAYAEIGGAVTFCGKPHRPIYEAAFALGTTLRGAPVERARTIAIGDALRTDLAGATGAGIDCLFVAAGIHAGELGLEGGGELSPRALAALFEDLPAEGLPVAATERLAW